MALHAKAKVEAGYRFYALYDKIYREDVLAHAYAQCRSNRGAPSAAASSGDPSVAPITRRTWRTGTVDGGVKARLDGGKDKR